MAALLQDISDPSIKFPEFLIIDTSLILELVPVFNHPLHSIVIGFLERLRVASKEGKVIPLLPYMVLEEIFFKICQKELENSSRPFGIKWHQYYKQNPQSIRSIYPKLIQLYQQLQAFTMAIIEPEDLALNKDQVASVVDKMMNFIERFCILPKDATILSEADRLGVYSIATLDRDLERADGFTVFLPPKGQSINANPM